MSSQCIGILHPGAMGATIGACLAAAGHEVMWASEGRSAATRRRAEAAGLHDAGSLAALLGTCDFVFSICPPHDALRLAQDVAALGFAGTFIDANAIAPDTLRAVQRTLTATSAARVVDGGIIGSSTEGPAGIRLYLAGPEAPAIVALFDSTPLTAIDLQAETAAASALKICYAAWSKAATALLANIRALARNEGVESALLAEWALTSPGTASRSDEVAAKANKAWRWVAEMQEIAATFTAAGLPADFHHGAADIFARLAAFKDVSPAPPMKDVLDRLVLAERVPPVKG